MIASGGIGDGRGLAAALALGAEGINMGTRFMATEEAPIHQNVKQAMVGADERSTALILRSLRNTRACRQTRSPRKPSRWSTSPRASPSSRPYVAGKRGRIVYETGDLEPGIWSAGMVIGLIHDIPSCTELVARIVAEAEAIIKSRLSGMAA